MDALRQAICRYADVHADKDGVAITPIEGLRIMCVRRPGTPAHAFHKPFICLVLQGAQQVTVGVETRTFSVGQSVFVALDAPVTGRIVEATPAKPYVALAIEVDMTLLRELATEFDASRPIARALESTLFVLDTEGAALDCATRLMRLLDTPNAVTALRPAILKELHYWLLVGAHGPAIRHLAMPDGHAEKIAAAVRLLRSDFRQPVAIKRLALAAGMSVPTFSRRFKALTSLTPLQFQKELKLLEARRLMIGAGRSASQAAYEVGYESASHFTREYRRQFGAPPKRNVRASRELKATYDAAYIEG